MSNRQISVHGMIVIERGDDWIRILEKPRTIVHILGAAVLVAGLVAYVAIAAVGAAIEATGATQRTMITNLLLIAVVLALVFLLGFAVTRTWRSRAATRGVVMEGEQVRIYTPDQIKRLYVLNRTDLLKAELSRSRHGGADLVLHLKTGAAIRALMAHPPDDLAPAQELLNATLRHMRHKGFEVVVPDGPVPVVPLDLLESPPDAQRPPASSA